MDFKKISDKIYENQDDRDRMEAMNDLYYEMADMIKNQMPSVYQDFTERAEDILWEITPEEARNIVVNMRPNGEKWTEGDVYTFIEAKGIDPLLDYYLAMNMAYNDYRNTAVQFGTDTADFYFSIARDFINDEDGKRHKVAKYFMTD